MNEKTSKPAMDFETAKRSMDSMQVTDCLNKTLDFLRRNASELSFPNISNNVEAFLVNLVSDTRNLKSRSFTDGDRSIVLEIIEILEISRDVFRFAYSYETGKANNKVLTYKKIYTNKMKKKRPAKPSSVAHRLVQSNSVPKPHPVSTHDSTPSTESHPVSSQDSTPSSFKLDFINKTLRFLRNDSERTLYYSEMPIAQAEYIQSVIETNGDNNVGFGFKSLYAPLWEAMDQVGEVFRLRITLRTSGMGYATLKLEKILKKDDNFPRNDNLSQTDKVPINTAPTAPENGTHVEPEATKVAKKKKKKSKKDKSANSSNSSSASSIPEPFSDQQLLSKLSNSFMSTTIQALARFAQDENSASLTFGELTWHGMCFVRKVKSWAASPEQRNKFPLELRDALLNLHNAVSQSQQNYRITTSIREKEGSITLKKTPLFANPPTPSPVNQTPVPVIARSKSLAAPTVTVRCTSKNRTVQFQTAGSKPEPPTEAKERGRSTSRILTKRKAKLLEDLSTPIESDKGIRMMLVMGWDGGALGARGDGITEPIMPALNLASKAGLGHVPPKVNGRDPGEFREAFFQTLSELIAGEDAVKVLQYKEPITKSEYKFIPATLHLLNCRRPAAVRLGPAAAGPAARLLRDLTDRPQVYVDANFGQDYRTVTLRKIVKQNAIPDKSNVRRESYDAFLTNEDIEVYMSRMEVPTPDKLKDRQFCGMAKKKRAARMLFMTVIEEALRSEAQEIRITFNGDMQAKLVSFIKSVVDSLNAANCLRFVSDYLCEGGERQAFGDMRRSAKKWRVAVEFTGRSHFVLKKTRKIYKPIINDMAEANNNNDDKMNNKNDGHTDKHNTEANNDDKKPKEISPYVVTSEGNKLIAALEKHRPNNDKNAIVNGDEMKNNANNAIINREGIEGVKNKIGTNNVVVKEEIVENKEVTDFNDRDYESDFDKELKDLEMAICKAELEHKAKNDDIGDLEMDISSLDIDAQIKEDVDNSNDLAMRIDDLVISKSDDGPGHKRSSTNLNSNDELDRKRSKLAIEIMIISPNDTLKKIDTDFIKNVQQLISDNIDETRDLPLLKCHGLQKRGLVYSGHSKSDIDWLKSVISKAEDLDFEIDSVDESLITKVRNGVAIKINTTLNVCPEKTFKRLEIYNSGLDTRYWKVLLSCVVEEQAFYIMLVEMDDASLKYISDKKYSLYCGIDGADFTVL